MTSNPVPNEDNDVDPEEMEAATNDLSSEATAPELDPATENLTTWDEPPTVAGGPAPKVLPEDEIPPAEQLIYEGVDEADRELRIAAADPDFEP